MEVKDFVEKVKKYAEDFGMQSKKDSKKHNTIIRENIKNIGNDNNAPFFAFIQPDQSESGQYADFSLVFFPYSDGTKYVMALVVGTCHFEGDKDLASRPGLRRLFYKILPVDQEHITFSKPDFADFTKPIEIPAEVRNADVGIGPYLKEIMIGCVVDSENDDDIIKAWVAQYADIRNWGTNESRRKAIAKAISQYRTKIESKIQCKSDEDTVKELLKKRRFVVLQGAPGTGKTFLAEKIARDEHWKKFMIQFHAETTYSDFVEGIMPDLDSNNLKYIKVQGKLLEAMNYAKMHPSEKVLLIIDEINRANLANVLGPIFYLFEPSRKEEENDGVEIGGEMWNAIPANLYVIATMNTADRSIAVVDFALRRRFAWYTVLPHFFERSEKNLSSEEKDVQDKTRDLFNRIAAIFEKHASDDELNLQPGGSYFLATTQEDLDFTIEYELMPLVKEYFDQGLLLSAKDEFCNLFFEKIHKELYR